MLVALPRVTALSYLQTDHDSVRFEAHIPLKLPEDPRSSIAVDVEMRLYIDAAINTNAPSSVHIIYRRSDLVLVRGAVGCVEWGAEKCGERTPDD